MKTIIVPTDFSPAAINAMNYAADMALEIDAKIKLVHVYQVPIAMTDTPIVMVSVEELRERAEERLEKLRAGLEHVTSGKIKIDAVAVLGDTIDELEEICDEEDPFVVVMGSVGHGALERSLFGSTTLSAIRHIDSPIIAVPVGKEYGKGIKKMGLASDFRDVEETTPFDVIHDIVKTFGAQLYVLNIDKDLSAEKLHETIREYKGLRDLNPEYHIIRHDDIEDGINEFAETNNLDLIIAIPKEHKLLEGIFKKSSTKQLIFESHVPVMCVQED